MDTSEQYFVTGWLRSSYEVDGHIPIKLGIYDRETGTYVEYR